MAAESLRFHDQPDAVGGSRRQRGKIVHRRPQPPGDDGDIGPAADLFQDSGQTFEIVPDPVETGHGDTGLLERLCDPGRVGIDQGAGADLVAGGKDFSVHMHSSNSGREGSRFRVMEKTMAPAIVDFLNLETWVVTACFAIPAAPRARTSQV